MTPSNFYPPPPPRRPSPPGQLAAILQTVLGALMLIYCMMLGALVIFFDPVMVMMREQGTPLPLPPEVTPEMFRMAAAAGALLGGAISVFLLIAAIFVYRGSRPAAISAFVVLGLVSIMLLFNTLGAPGVGGISGAMGVLICLGVLALAGTIMLRLWQVITAPPPMYSARFSAGGSGLPMMPPSMHYGFPPQWLPPPGAPPIGMSAPPTPPPQEMGPPQG